MPHQERKVSTEAFLQQHPQFFPTVLYNLLPLLSHLPCPYVPPFRYSGTAKGAALSPGLLCQAAPPCLHEGVAIHLQFSICNI